jgi:hypothetical protein
MKRLLLGMLGLLLAGSLLAGGLRSVRARVEGSMVVTGTIGVTPQGTVLGYTLDHPEKLPPVVVDTIAKNLPKWTFEPVLQDGKPVAAKAKMSLRLVARPVGGDKYQVAVRSAYFGDESAGIKLVGVPQSPRYPSEAIQERASGTTYVMLRVDRAGHVADAFVEQVNMRVLASDEELNRMRKLLAEASLKALRQWNFTPADSSDRTPFRVVRVPVSYQVSEYGHRSPPEVYGQWESYVPGPVEPAPWVDKDKALAGGIDAFPSDGVYGPSQLSLLTPLDHG